MERKLLGGVFIFLGLLASCSGRQTETGELETIRLATAFENQTELKASDCFSQVHYVTLETLDSCLIGNDPLIQIASDRIIVMTSHQQCFAFDKQTGKFLHSIGHVGDDPEACREMYGWLNGSAEQLYFPSIDYRKMTVYDLDNRFIRKQPEVLTLPEGSICPLEYDYWDKETLLVHSYATETTPDCITFIRDTSVLSVFPTNSEPANEHTPRLGIDVDKFSIATEGTGGHKLYIILDDGKSSLVASENKSPFWHFGKDVFFKGNFNDTIYRVMPDGLHPERLLDLGSYHWDVADWYYAHKDKGFYLLDFFENGQIVLFRFCRNLYHEKERVAYNAVYNKRSGKVMVAPYDSGLINDLGSFLPLQPVTSNSEGEFAQLIQPGEIVSWFEEHPEVRNLPDDVEQLRKVGEEDNPVVVIMK